MSINSAYKNVVGVAKVTTDTVIATNVAATATSVKVVSATGITTASTIVILDGPLTETKAVTAVATTTLTVAALAHPHSRGIYVFALPTSGFGPTAFIPMRTFKPVDKIAQLYNTARLGSLGDKAGVVQGMRTSEWTFEGDVFYDTFGYLLGGYFGAETYAAGPPKTHAFSVLNTGNGQPVKYAYFVYDAFNTRVVVGRVTKLGMKFDPKALITYSGTLTARASGVTTTLTASFSAVGTAPTWRAALLITTTYTRLPTTFTVTFSRQEVENIPTINGTQDPLDTYVGANQSSGKISFVRMNDTVLNKFLAGTLQKFVLSFTQGTGATEVGLAVQFAKANYESDELDLQGKAYNTDSLAFSAIDNATDATSTGSGLSAGRVTLTNAITNGKYT